MTVCQNCGDEIVLRNDGVWIHEVGVWYPVQTAMCLLGKYAWAEPKK